MKTIYIFITCFMVMKLNAQQITPKAIPAGGTSATAGSITIEYAIGEPAGNSLSTSNNIITQGVLQPMSSNTNFNNSNITLAKLPEAKNISIKAWPLPAVNNINIIAEGIGQDVLLVYDINGKLVQQLRINNKTALQITGLSAGAYIIKIAGTQDVAQKIIMQ